MGQKVIHGDRPLGRHQPSFAVVVRDFDHGVREFRNVLADGIVERDHTPLIENQRRRRGEHLPDRRQGKNRVVPHGYALRHLTRGTQPDDLAVTSHHGNPRGDSPVCYRRVHHLLDGIEAL